MKKAKKLASLLMVLAMVCSLLTVSASADCTGSAKVSLDQAAVKDSYSRTFAFPIGNGFNYWKIHIRTFNPNLQFKITKDSPKGQVVYSSSSAGYGACVPTGGQPYYGYLPAGTYYVTIFVVGSQTSLQGTLWYKSATNEAEAM